MAQLKRLFEPIRIGNMEAKNRLLMISMATGYGGEGGRPTERLKKFLVERAEGGNRAHSHHNRTAPYYVGTWLRAEG